MSSETPKRICIIGAGAAGMSAVYHFDNMKRDNVANVPEVVCYEKYSDWGGMWNYSWRTGVDEHGELSFHGMYHNLWSNGPKECLEYPDYTFEDHFGRAIPSFPPRAVLRDYLEGRWTRNGRNLRQYVRFETIVKNVEYHKETDDFTVTVKYLPEDREMPPERFTHILIAVGTFNVPNVPNVKGLESFTGRVLHSHDFRDAREFKGKRLLVVGNRYSGEDMAIHGTKFGAESVIVSYRTNPSGWKWPKIVTEKPLVQKVQGKTAYFSDGTSAEVDAIIMATGYQFHYPFMPEELRLKTKLTMYADNLFKGTIWNKGGNNKVFYLGIYDQYFSYSVFDVQSLWTCMYIMNKLPENAMTKEERDADVKKWRSRAVALKGYHEEIDFQSAFIAELSKNTNYHPAAAKGNELFHEWETHREQDITTYRDKCFRSLFTGTMSPLHHTPFMDAYDDSLETFVYQTPNKVTGP